MPAALLNPLALVSCPEFVKLDCPRTLTASSLLVMVVVSNTSTRFLTPSVTNNLWPAESIAMVLIPLKPLASVGTLLSLLVRSLCPKT